MDSDDIVSVHVNRGSLHADGDGVTYEELSFHLSDYPRKTKTTGEWKKVILDKVGPTGRRDPRTVPIFQYPFPVCVEVTFKYRRPSWHFQRRDRHGQLTSTAPIVPLSNVSDTFERLGKAMVTTVYGDSSQVVQLALKNVFVDKEDEIGTKVIVSSIFDLDG
jgi:hypothetical protein